MSHDRAQHLSSQFYQQPKRVPSPTPPPLPPRNAPPISSTPPPLPPRSYLTSVTPQQTPTVAPQNPTHYPPPVMSPPQDSVGGKPPGPGQLTSVQSSAPFVPDQAPPAYGTPPPIPAPYNRPEFQVLKESSIVPTIPVQRPATCPILQPSPERMVALPTSPQIEHTQQDHSLLSSQPSQLSPVTPSLQYPLPPPPPPKYIPVPNHHTPLATATIPFEAMVSPIEPQTHSLPSRPSVSEPMSEIYELSAEPPTPSSHAAVPAPAQISSNLPPNLYPLPLQHHEQNLQPRLEPTTQSTISPQVVALAKALSPDDPGSSIPPLRTSDSSQPEVQNAIVSPISPSTNEEQMFLPPQRSLTSTLDSFLEELSSTHIDEEEGANPTIAESSEPPDEEYYPAGLLSALRSQPSPRLPEDRDATQSPQQKAGNETHHPPFKRHPLKEPPLDSVVQQEGYLLPYPESPEDARQCPYPLD